MFQSLSPLLFLFRLSLLLFLFCFHRSPVQAQGCQNLFGLTKNARYEYELLDKRNKPIGRVRNMVLAVETDPAETRVMIKSGVYGPNNNLKHATDYTYRCSNDSVYYDKMLLLDHDNQKNFEGKEQTITGTDLVWPLHMAAGQNLPEGNLLITVIVFNRPVATINHRVYDRKIVGTEEITTPAGTFTCYKVEYTYEVVTTAAAMRLKKRDFGVSYFSPGNGIIKTQFTSKDGKRNLNSIVLHSRTNFP